MVLSGGFPWYYRENLTKANTRNTILGSVGFDYGLVDKRTGRLVDSRESHITSCCLYLIKDYIEATSLLKARYDMTIFNPNKFRHDPHIDLNHPDFLSVILYMNDSDGETVIFEEKCYNTDQVECMTNLTVKKSVEPKSNRLLVFNGHYLHTGHSPSKTNKRILLNSVYGKN